MTVYEGVLPGGEGLAEKDARTPEQRAERGDYVGCIAGAPSFAEYRGGLETADFSDIGITPTHPVADGMHSAIVRATKPLNAGEPTSTAESTGACCGVDACCTPAETAVDPAPTVTEAKTASGCGCQN